MLFIARRGHITELISDNGANFVEANNYLKKMEAIHLSIRSDATLKFATPDTPYHGGLYEAAV